MHDFESILAQTYGLEIISIAPLRDAFIVHTSNGKKMLKKTLLPCETISFVHGAKEHLYNNGFMNLDRYACTLEEKPYFTIEGINYTLGDLVGGRECNFENRDDVVKTTRQLAYMHKYSKGYFAPEDSKAKDDLGKLPIGLNKRLNEIKRLKKNAKKGKSKFDYLFLEYADYFYNIGENSINMINNSNYNKLVEEYRVAGGICHHDFTHHNIICAQDKVSIINFEFCCYELKVYDVVNLMRRKMRKCKWDVGEGKLILDQYRMIEDIDEDEYLVMKVMLQFPQKFWRVINKYYNSRRSWSEKSYLSKLQEVIDEIPYHKEFMNNYDSFY